jgi:hypothetical protein
VICSSDEKSYEAMLSLMAWQLQNIGKPSRVIMVLHNPKQQAGKGTICQEVLLPIYGPSGICPSATDQILGRFNDTLRGKSYIFLDEIVFHGDIRTANRLKALSTATSIGIESKGLPTVQCPVGVNLWIASNAETPVHIEDGDARYWMIKISEHRIGDADYFDALHAEIKNGGREAFAQFLIHRDVMNFRPSRDVPKHNETRLAAIADCLNPYDARVWPSECATNERIGGDDWKTGVELSNGELWDAYIKWQRGIRGGGSPKPTKNAVFGEMLGQAGFAAKKTGGVRLRVLPDPDDCLKRLSDPKFGNLQKPDEIKPKTRDYAAKFAGII